MEPVPEKMTGKLGGGYVSEVKMRTKGEQGLLEVAEPAVGELEAEQVGGDGAHEADEEEEAEGVVDLAGGELARGADDTPDDAGGAEHLGGGADEAVLLRGVAHVLDVGEHPRLDAELRGAGDDGGDDLAPEHRLGRDLHVVAELEIGGEGERLRHGDVTPGLEQHHGDGASGEAVTDDQLGDDVQANLLIRDSLDHADGDDVEEGDDEREDEPLAEGKKLDMHAGRDNAMLTQGTWSPRPQ